MAEQRLKDEAEILKRIDEIRPSNPKKSDYTHGIDVGLAMAKVAIKDAPTIEERKTGKWSGFWSEPQNDDSVYGEKLNEGDTIYLFGVEGTVRQECGAWGWGSPRYVPWEELEKRMPHNNCPDFCYCDNFISFWELKWNFDDGYDWDGVPFIRHDADMRQEGEDNE